MEYLIKDPNGKELKRYNSKAKIPKTHAVIVLDKDNIWKINNIHSTYKKAVREYNIALRKMNNWRMKEVQIVNVEVVTDEIR